MSGAIRSRPKANLVLDYAGLRAQILELLSVLSMRGDFPRILTVN